MSFYFKHSPKDWLLNPAIMREAGKAIVDDVKVYRDFDVPYVAGYSKKRDLFAIDHAFPRGFDHEGEFFDVTIPIILHEAFEDGVEKLITNVPYQLPHQCALHVEKAYVEACGVPWDVYNRWCMQQIKLIGGRKRYDHCPPWLDLEPYLDEEDWATLEKMFANGKPLWNGKRVHPDVR